LKVSRFPATLLFACGLLLAASPLAMAGSWKEVSELSQKAMDLSRSGKPDEAARAVISATRMRQALPPKQPSDDRSDSDGFASKQLENAFLDVANRYAEKSRWADVITFCKWHIGDNAHLNTVGIVTAYTSMANAYRSLNDLPDAEKCYKLAMTAYDRGRSAMGATEMVQCKKMFPGYARLLKLQNKEAEAQAITAKFAL